MPYKDVIKQKEAQHQHYLNNKNKYTESRKLNREKHKIWLADYKKTLSCETCGENHPACLDFHHIDPSLKEDSINRIKQRYSLEYLKKEIEKCKVLCSNCHRKLHWKNGLGGSQQSRCPVKAKIVGPAPIKTVKHLRF